MMSTEAPATPSPARARANWGYFWGMVLGASLAIFYVVTLTKPKQFLRVINTGSQTVDMLNVSASWKDRKVLTVHPDMIGSFMFRDGDLFRITPRPEKKQESGMPPLSPLPPRTESFGTKLIHEADGSGTIVIKHASRTAEVRVSEAGKIEFEFTDL